MYSMARYITIFLVWVSFFGAIGLVTAILLLKPAHSAEQSAPPNEQALSNKLLAELQAGLSCSVATIQLQLRVKELETQLAEAKKPAEPAK